MNMLLIGLLCGALFSAITAFFIARHIILRLTSTAAELEHQLRSHSFELQVALDELAAKNQLLQQQSQRDALSGLYNRAYFDQQIRAELKRSRREQRSLALVLLDIDHFKQINDNHGHLAGDKAIQQVAQLMQQQLKRPGDKLCRYGGEEFALILPNTSLDGAMALAEQIRQQLAEHGAAEQQAITLTLSAGCYAAVPGQHSDGDEYIRFADSALYRAKAGGRNQVLGYPPLAPVSVEVLSGDVNEH